MKEKIKTYNASYIFIIFAVITAGGMSAVSLYRFNRLVYPIVFTVFSGVAGGFIIKLQMVAEKLTSKVRSEKIKLGDIVKAMADPAIVLDSDYRIIVLNCAWESLFDIDEISVLGRHFMEIMKDENLFGYISYSCSLPQNSEPKVVCIDSKGKDSYFNVVVRPFGDEAVIILQNLTHLKELEKIKTNFISIVSNEFKTPLTSMMIGISMFANENIGSLSEKQKKIVETIKEDIEGLSNLVENLIQMSSIELDKPHLNMDECNIADIIEECIKNLDDKIKNHSISLTYRVEDNLPKVIVDYGQIILAINNLLKSCLKYTEAGNSIIISASLSSENFCICIKDTGAGISPEYHEKLFEKFADIKDNNLKIHNMGLEMATAKEIIEAHGGEIWYDSKPGLENVLTFTLPFHSINSIRR